MRMRVWSAFRYAVIVLLVVGGLLLSGRALHAQNPTRTPLPSVTPSPTVSLGIATGLPGPSATPTDMVSAAMTATALKKATGTGPTLAPSMPSATATSPLLAASPTSPNTTPQPTKSLVQVGIAPQYTIKLPEGWGYAYQRVPVRTGLDEQLMNVAIYRGPLPKAIGTIVVLWAYPSTVAPPTIAPLPGTPTPIPGSGGDILSQMLWTDGLRLLQGAILDITCNVGTTGQRAFSVGPVQGVGTFFNVTGCQGEPETAGWFVGVNQYGRNYLFYAYVEPVESYNDARGDLQKILDTVQFVAPATGTPAPATPGPSSTPKP